MTSQVREIRAKQSLQHPSAETTLESQLAFAAEISFKRKGQQDLLLRRIFGCDDLDYFASAIKMYGDLGFPMEYWQIQAMMYKTVKKRGLVDWKTGELFTVSPTYVRDFVNSRPDLKAYKASNIDPLRTKKATETVCVGALVDSFHNVSCVPANRFLAVPHALR